MIYFAKKLEVFDENIAKLKTTFSIIGKQGMYNLPVSFVLGITTSLSEASLDKEGLRGTSFLSAYLPSTYLRRRYSEVA